MSKLQALLKTITREELINLYAQTKSVYKMAEHFGVSNQTVTRAMDFHGIKRSNNGNRKHHFNDRYFDVIDSQDKAYWLGFIMADGCVYKGTGDTYRLQINLKADDAPHLNKFQQAIGSDYKVSIKEVGGSKVAQLKVNSTVMCLDLIKHGVTERKSLVCQLPSIDESLMSHYIRGYFDGDGCISFTVNDRMRKSFSIVGGEKMLKAINKYLQISLRQVEGKSVHEIYTHDSKKITDIFEYLYKDAYVYLTRKKRSYEIVNYILKSPLME